MGTSSRAVFAATAAASGLLLLLAAAGGVQADPSAGADKDGQQVVKRTVVLVDDDGKEQVFEDSGGPALKRGYLGAQLTELTPELRDHFGAPKNAGVMVARVEAGSPAAKAGLQVGDIVTSLDGKAVESSWDLRARVRKLADGAVVPIEVRRGSGTQTLSARIEQRDRPEIDIAPLFIKREGDGPLLHLGHGPLVIEKEGAVPGRRVEVRGFTSAREEQLEKKLKALEKRLSELESRLPKN
jgi:membrane-associated protease RseP (regulator of RpoE activity)